LILDIFPRLAAIADTSSTADTAILRTFDLGVGIRALRVGIGNTRGREREPHRTVTRD